MQQARYRPLPADPSSQALELRNSYPSRWDRRPLTLIYRRTKNLRAVQLLLGHSKLESTVKYLGIEVEDALEIAEQTEI